jgi:hypothetical protein
LDFNNIIYPVPLTPLQILTSLLPVSFTVLKGLGIAQALSAPVASLPRRYELDI